MTVTVDYYHFLISPWSHLASARLEALRSRTGARIRYLPIEVARTFADMGGTPPAKRHPSRQSWRLEELGRWAAHLDVPIVLEPPFFPADQALAARLVLAAGELDEADGGGDGPSSAERQSLAGRLSDAVLAACWRDGRDVADRATLESLVDGLGVDRDALFARAEEWSLIERAREVTDEAHARGVFGSPTWIVGEERFWGQDRLEFLERAIEAKAG